MAFKLVHGTTIYPGEVLFERKKKHILSQKKNKLTFINTDAR